MNLKKNKVENLEGGATPPPVFTQRGGGGNGLPHPPQNHL